MKIGIQGIKGSFHHIIARQYYEGQEIEIVECDTFKDLSKKLHEGNIDQAVMAIENTLAGSILPNFSLIQKYGFKVVGETYLRIQMNLIANPGVNMSAIKEVKSHPIALLQCDQFFAAYPHIKLTEINDTAEGVKLIKEGNITDVAVIGSELACELYEMDFLAKGIETDKKNFTRFLILDKKQNKNDRANKASVVFQLHHEVGNLVDILMILKCHEMNMTKIQSAPILGKPYEYNFHIDLTWDSYEYFQHCMDIVQRNVSHLAILGEYQQGDRNLQP